MIRFFRNISLHKEANVRLCLGKVYFVVINDVQ